MCSNASRRAESVALIVKFSSIEHMPQNMETVYNNVVNSFSFIALCVSISNSICMKTTVGCMFFNDGSPIYTFSTGVSKYVTDTPWTLSMIMNLPYKLRTV